MTTRGKLILSFGILAALAWLWWMGHKQTSQSTATKCDVCWHGTSSGVGTYDAHPSPPPNYRYAVLRDGKLDGPALAYYRSEGCDIRFMEPYMSDARFINGAVTARMSTLGFTMTRDVHDIPVSEIDSAPRLDGQGECLIRRKCGNLIKPTGKAEGPPIVETEEIEKPSELSTLMTNLPEEFERQFHPLEGPAPSVPATKEGLEDINPYPPETVPPVLVAGESPIVPVIFPPGAGGTRPVGLPTPVTASPEPGGLLLAGSALVGISIYKRRS